MYHSSRSGHIILLWNLRNLIQILCFYIFQNSIKSFLDLFVETVSKLQNTVWAFPMAAPHVLAGDS